MSDQTLPSTGAYRALLVPDQRFTLEALDRAASTISEAGPRAGVPVPGRATRAILEATGEQEDQTITLTAVRGGFARDAGGAAFTWESTGVTGEIGWETPTALVDIAPVVVTTPIYARPLATAPAICALPDGRVVAAYNRQSSSTLDKVSTSTRAAVGVWGSPVDVGLTGDTAEATRTKIALFWDDARQLVRLYLLWRDTTISGLERGRLSLYTSGDGGATWVLSQEDCLTTPLDWSAASTGYDVHGISIAFAGDALGCLLISVTSHDTSLDLLSTVVQYASGDGGFSFSLVEAYAPTTSDDPLGGVSYTVYADLHGTLGFRAVWSSATSTDVGQIYQTDLGSPYSSWSTVTGNAVEEFLASLGSITSKVLSPTSISVAVDPIGSAWVYVAASLTANARIIALVIGASGVGSFIEDAYGLGVPWVFGPWDAGEGVEELAAAFVSGGVVLLGRLRTASASAYTGALAAITLGGYTGATRRPVRFGGALSAYNAPYEIDWFGSAGFGDFTPWSTSPTGSPTLSLGTDLGFSIACSNFIDSYQTTYSPGAAGAVQGHAQLIAEVHAGVADFSVKAADVVHLRLRISPTDIVVRNATAGIDMQTLSLPTPGAHIVRVSWHQGSGSTVYWRVEVTPWTSGATVRAWDSYDGTLSAAVSAGDRCRLEVPYLGDATFYHVGFGAGPNGAGLASDILTPRPFSSTPAPVYHGVSVALTAGPVMGGDSWMISPSYDYGVRRIFQEIEPSPRAKWKATADASTTPTELVFDLTEGGAPCRFGSPVVGLGFFGANFRTATIQTGGTSSGPWTTVATADLSCGLSGLAWERVGNTVSAPGASPATGPHYCPENALAGGTFVYKSGEAARILRNTGGVWAAGANIKRPRLSLDAPSADASGTGGVILFPDAVALVYGLANVSFLKIVIPVQDTASGVIELGSLVLGRVEILGHQYGRGRSLEVAPSVDVFTSSNGARRTRTLGPQRRLITVDWQDQALDTSLVWSDPANAAYIRAASGEAPAAYVAATADQVRGLLGQLDGAPLVYVSKLDADKPTMISPLSLLRGRVLGPLTIDAVLGDEEATEVVRIAGFTVEEEL